MAKPNFSPNPVTQDDQSETRHYKRGPQFNPFLFFQPTKAQKQSHQSAPSPTKKPLDINLRPSNTNSGTAFEVIYQPDSKGKLVPVKVPVRTPQFRR